MGARKLDTQGYYQQQRDLILHRLANDKQLNQFVDNVTLGNKNYTDDLYQELFLHLCELSPEKITEINEKGYLNFYILRFLTNQFRSTKSPFHYQYRNKRFIHIGFFKDFEFSDQVDEPGIYDEHTKEYFSDNYAYDLHSISLQIHRTLEQVKNVKGYPYEYELFIFKLESGLSYTEISKQTHIPRNSLVTTCVSVKKKIIADLKAAKLIN